VEFGRRLSNEEGMREDTDLIQTLFIVVSVEKES